MSQSAPYHRSGNRGPRLTYEILETCLFVPGISRGECASWVQAWGSILAILAAGLFVVLQHNLELKRQRRARDQDNLCAGNFALLTISAQYNDLLIYRRGLREEIQRRAQVAPDAPAWLLAPVIGHSFLESREIDLKSLSFLFDTRAGLAAYGSLALSEHHYATLRILNNQLAADVREIQQTMAALEVGEAAQSNAQLAAAVSIDKKSRTTDLLIALLRESQGDEVFTKSFRDLRAALVAVLGEARIPRSVEASEGHREQDMPPLPDVLARRLAAMVAP